MNNKPTHKQIARAAGVAWLAATAAALGGSLNPPPGPIAPTDAVTINGQAVTLPYVIAAPGAYRLTSDLLAGGGVDGVVIAASDVTLDLGGFTIFGGTGDGVVAQPGTANITVRNGSVRGWDDDGLDLFQATTVRVENVTALDNGDTGFTAAEAQLVGCLAARNGAITGSGDGFEIAGPGSADRCHAVDNADNGFFVSEGVRLAGCVATRNGRNGFEMAFHCVAVECVAKENIVGVGFVSVEHCTLADCVATRNGTDGIVVAVGGLAVDCVATENASLGFFADLGAVVTGCRASRSGADGFLGIAGARFETCSANENGQHGFNIDDGVTVRDCNASLNQASGVYALNRCRVEAVHAWNNGAGGALPSAGIEVPQPGQQNRIADNSCIDNPTDYLISGTRNTVFSNSSSTTAGANYTIAPGNDVAPIAPGAAVAASRLDNIIY